MNSKFTAIPLVLLFAGLFLASSTAPLPSFKNSLNEEKEKYLCLSLSQLINAEKFSTTQAAPPGLDTLFGMSWLEGYVLDLENHDIILFGKQDPSRRPLNFFDVLINFQNVFGDTYQAPFCSLDPLPENVKKLEEVLQSEYDSYQAQYEAAYEAVGGQQVLVGGVPDYSRHAAIMIYADYDMKAVSQGHIRLPGVRSILEIYKRMPGLETSLSSRFWFHIKKPEAGVSYPNFVYDTGILKINECPVIILTEKQQMDAEGNLSDKNAENDPVSETFAKEFSTNFQNAVLINPNFCELENLYRLHALFLAMKSKGAIGETGFDKAPFFRIQLVPTEGLPKELPGLVNADLTNNSNQITFSLVAGGVSMEMDVDNLTKQASLSELQQTIFDSRPDEAPIHWFAEF